MKKVIEIVTHHYYKDGELWECLYCVEIENGIAIFRKIPGTDRRTERSKTIKKEIRGDN